MKDIKIIANYLPQYHEIPENNKFWGKGYTDWIAVKKAKAVIENQVQPKIPLNNNYYSLDNPEEIKKQAEMAKHYNIYGFGIYHYWFSTNDYLLETPSEIILNDETIDINYMFLWDNSTWKRTWSNVKNANDWAPNYDNGKENEVNSNGILKQLNYGTEDDWEAHFRYLLKFFRDKRYIKVDGKPMFGFFQPQNGTEVIKQMINFWDDLAKKEGFSGLYVMTRDDRRNFGFNRKFKYSPLVECTMFYYLRFKLKQIVSKKREAPLVFSYDKCWKEIINEARRTDDNTFLSGFVKYDDTPRRGKKAKIIVDASPEKFKNYMQQLIDISKKQNKDFIFLTAWNEWGEGCYLEPDTVDGYAYLEKCKELIDEN